MKKMMNRIWLLALLALVSMPAMAQEEAASEEDTPKEVADDWQVTVSLNDSYANGLVEVVGQVLNEEDQSVTVTISVTPDDGYGIATEDIKVVLTRPIQLTREGDPHIDDGQLTISETDTPNQYTFSVPAGFGAWVQEVIFRAIDNPIDISGENSAVTWDMTEEGTLTISGTGGTKDFAEGGSDVPWDATSITAVVIDASVTRLGANIFQGCDYLASITINNSVSVLELGEGALPDNENLQIDVQGNLYNEYLITEGWKDQTIDSKNAVQMSGITFSENNSYDTFVSAQDVQVPSVLKAYTITGINGAGLVLTPVTSIAAGEAVLVFTEHQEITDFRTAVVTDGLDKTSQNLLQVAGSEGKEVALGEVYLLYNDVFYYAQAGTIPAGGVYLEPQSKSGTRSFYSLGGGDGTTAIDSQRIVSAEGSSAWYGLDGRRLAAKPTRKGIYVKDGKKVIIR